MGNFFGYALVAYLLGLGAHSLFPWTRIAEVWWIAIFVLGVVAWTGSSRAQIGRAYVFVACAFALGVWRFDVTIPRPTEGMIPWIGQEATMEGTVLSRGGSMEKPTMTVRVRTVGGERIKGPGERMLIRVRSAPEAGTNIAFTCFVRKPSTFPSSLERRRSLARKGIWTECPAATETIFIASASPFDPFVHLARYRERLTRRISRVLPPDHAALMTGILYGDQDLSDETKELFRRAGLMHIVAVSGSNVTILVNIVFPIVIWFGARRQHAFWIVSVGLVAFIGFVGCSASVMRAGYMGWLALLARHVGRIAWTDRLLLVAAACLTFLNPWLLAFDPGFALSFLATWGLLVWTPILLPRLSLIPNAFGLREIAATTCGATLMTAPYLAWAFGRMSLAGLITNILALPLIPWTMCWGAIVAVWGDGPGAAFVALPAHGLLDALVSIARIADHLPWLDIRIPSLDAWFMAAMYACVWYAWRLSTISEQES